MVTSEAEGAGDKSGLSFADVSKALWVAMVNARWGGGWWGWWVGL